MMAINELLEQAFNDMINGLSVEKIQEELLDIKKEHKVLPYDMIIEDFLTMCFNKYEDLSAKRVMSSIIKNQPEFASEITEGIIRACYLSDNNDFAVSVIANSVKQNLTISFKIIDTFMKFYSLNGEKDLIEKITCKIAEKSLDLSLEDFSNSENLEFSELEGSDDYEDYKNYGSHENIAHSSILKCHSKQHLNIKDINNNSGKYNTEFSKSNYSPVNEKNSIESNFIEKFAKGAINDCSTTNSYCTFTQKYNIKNNKDLSFKLSSFLNKKTEDKKDNDKYNDYIKRYF